MKTTEAVTTAMQLAAQSMTQQQWQETLKSSHVAAQVARINSCINTGGMVAFAIGGEEHPIATLMQESILSSNLQADLVAACRHARNGSDDLCGAVLRKLLDAAIDSLAEINATSIMLGEEVPMNFQVRP